MNLALSFQQQPTRVATATPIGCKQNTTTATAVATPTTAPSQQKLVKKLRSLEADSVDLRAREAGSEPRSPMTFGG